jgi:hypothetical protein
MSEDLGVKRLKIDSIVSAGSQGLSIAATFGGHKSAEGNHNSHFQVFADALFGFWFDG